MPSYCIEEMKYEQWLLICVVFVIIIIGVVFLNKNIEMFGTKDYLEGIDVIYWINLDRSLDRRKRMKKMFKEFMSKYFTKNLNPMLDKKFSEINELNY